MPPKNVAAPNAVKLFHCKICDKGYSRQTDYENHLRSYDHNHRQRLADMKQITAANDRDNNRKGKRGINEMRRIPIDNQPGLAQGFKKIGTETGGAGAGFKKVGVSVEGAADGFKKAGVTTSTTPALAGFNRIGVTASGSGSDPVAVTETPSEPVEPVEPAATPVEPVSSSANVDNAPSEAEIEALPIKLPTENEAISELQQDLHFHDDDGEDSGMTDDDEDLEGTDDEEDLGGAKDGEDSGEAKDGGDVAMSESGDEYDEEVTWEEYDFRKPSGCDPATCPCPGLKRD